MCLALFSMFTFMIDAWLLPLPGHVMRCADTIGSHMQVMRGHPNINPLCKHSHILEFLLNRVHQIYPPSHPWSQGSSTINDLKDPCFHIWCMHWAGNGGHLRSESMLVTWKVKVILVVSGCVEYGSQNCKCSYGCLFQKELLLDGIGPIPCTLWRINSILSNYIFLVPSTAQR